MGLSIFPGKRTGAHQLMRVATVREGLRKPRVGAVAIYAAATLLNRDAPTTLP